MAAMAADATPQKRGVQGARALAPPPPPPPPQVYTYTPITYVFTHS